MAFCKVCTCGEKIVFEKRLSFPDKCPSCKRTLVNFDIFEEDDPRVKELLKDALSLDCDREQEDSARTTCNEISKKKYILRLNNGDEIKIPSKGCIVGRNEIGAEQLTKFPTVSRQHLKVTPKKNGDVILVDISRYGTLVAGQRIKKGVPIKVVENSKVTLCDLETMLLIIKEEEV